MTGHKQGAWIQLGDANYELALTLKATREIAERFGGLDTLGDKLSNPKNFAEALADTVWLVTLLINQGNARRRLEGESVEDISEEFVETISSPADFMSYQEALTKALELGTKRHILSKDSPKNV